MALFLCACYAFSFLALHFWLADLLRHFILQYAIGAVLFGVLFMFKKSWLYGGLMALVLLSCGFELASLTRITPQSETAGIRLKVIQYNQLVMKREPENFLRWINSQSPDIAIIHEPNHDTLKELKTLAPYPHVAHKIPDNPYGFILLSKYPIIEKDITVDTNIVYGNISGHFIIDIPDYGEISLYAAHPASPGHPIRAAHRNYKLQTLADKIAEDHSKTIIVMGDFNITPYSPYFKKFKEKTHLKNEYTSLLPPPTWPRQFTAQALQIPIDHIMHKGQIELIEKKRGEAFHSDHYSLIAEFILTP